MSPKSIFKWIFMYFFIFAETVVPLPTPECNKGTRRKKKKMENENDSDWATGEDGEEGSGHGLAFYGTEGHEEEVSYSDVVRKYPVVRQSYMDGHRGVLGTAVAACYHWKQQIDDCLRTQNPASCAKLQLQLMICLGQRVAPLQFEQLRGCLASNGNNVAKCEDELLGMADQINSINQQDQQPEQVGLTAWECQQLAQCGRGATTTSEIDCMIPRVCGEQHQALRRCVIQQRQRSSALMSTNEIVGTQCLGLAKQVLHCWGAFNRRREHTETTRGQPS